MEGSDTNTDTVLDDARGVLSEGPICDGCLGRRFASLSHGLTSRERGRSLRTVVAMEDDEPYDTVPPEECWVCDGAFSSFGDWAERAADALSGYELGTYLVGTRVPPLVEENERLLDDLHGADRAASFSSEFNREVGRRLGEITGAEVDLERPDVTVTIDIPRGEVECDVHSEHFYGRYRKLERGVAQTEWECRECDATGETDGGRCGNCGGTGHVYDVSVEEEIALAFVEATEGEGAVFHGAGREDVDALMLGDGRPFVMEVENPRHRNVDTDALQEDISDRTDVVEVRSLRRTDSDAPERVKGVDADKLYRATVRFSESVSAAALEDALDELVGTVEQRTPGRVDHRRADRVREREVYEATTDDEVGDTIDEANIELRTEGGTYVKELVSGDEGRTDPSLADELGVGAEVERLDVLAVDADDEELAGQ